MDYVHALLFSLLILFCFDRPITGVLAAGFWGVVSMLALYGPHFHG